MKNLVFLFLLIIFFVFSCKSKKETDPLLTDNEWRDVLINTLFLAEGQKPYIYKEYDNSRLKTIISDIYINSSEDLGYEISDSILNYINNRKNSPITNKLDTMLNVSYIYDTVGFNKNYVIYSEPFYVNKETLCISMINKKVLENITLKWVFFLKKQNSSLKTIEFYDINKDMFYRPAYMK